MLHLLLRVLIAAAVALVVYFVLTALITFAHAALVFGLVAAAIFLAIAFSPIGGPRGPRRRGW